MARPRRGTSSGEPVERPPDLDRARFPFPPMEAELVRELPDGPTGSTSRSGTASAACSRTARASCGSGRATGGRCSATSRSCGRSEKLLPPRSALDGEIVIERDGVLDFDAMQTRLHPAESRVRKLSAEIPARSSPSTCSSGRARRSGASRSRSAGRSSSGAPSASSSRPRPHDRDEALGWLERFEAIGLDGVVAKRRDLAYLPGSRDGVVKVKPEKTADCVVVGVRWKSQPDRIATLLLGLYGDDGELDYVGSAAVAPARHDEIAERVLPLLEDAPERRFSEPNRWGGGELEESPVRPELVVEVRYDKVQSNRFRHGTKLLRFRDDKDPAQCTWRELRPPPRTSGPTRSPRASAP